MSTHNGSISRGRRAAALAVFASLILVTAPTSPSIAGSATPLPSTSAAASPSHEATDFSAARRRYYRRGPSAAGLAFMGIATGLIAGAIAEQRRREYYENYYYAPGPYYGSGPYYGPGYGYYGGEPYNGPRYYRRW